jgi:tripartite-type tricarboxylate transporter receptor subunit TctC
MADWKSGFLKRATALFVLCLAFLSLEGPVFSAAGTYPSKPIRFIVPFAPGGVTDMVSRLMSGKLSERLGQQVIVENMGGGAGIPGLERTAKAAPDGYTLCIATLSFAYRPALEANLPFDIRKDFTPIAKLGGGVAALAVNPNVVPAKTLKEFIALAKQKPGQLIFSSGVVGSPSHLMAELFKDKTNVDFKIVNFKSAGPALTDLLGGHSHFNMTSTMTLIPYAKSGQLRLLGTTGLMRSALLPDVPTISEAGAPGFEVSDWWGIIAPAGIPSPIIERLEREIKAILTMDDVKKQFLNSGAEADYQGSAEFGKFIDHERDKWTKIIRKANIKLGD